MTKTTYDVRVWKLQSRKNTHGKITSHRARWEVASQTHQETFKTKAQAESFRAELISAARKGEAFDVTSGLPVSLTRGTEDRNWFDFACDFVDMKWRDTSPGQRKSTADSLAPISTAMLATQRGAPAQKTLNQAFRLAFNPSSRGQEQPPQIERALKWIADHSRNVSDLSKPDVLRDVLGALDLKQDGTRAAPGTVRLRRTTLTNTIHYAIERKLLASNPLQDIKVRRHNHAEAGRSSRRGEPRPGPGAVESSQRANSTDDRLLRPHVLRRSATSTPRGMGRAALGASYTRDRRRVDGQSNRQRGKEPEAPR